jgi:hypothetical protein
MAREIFKPVIVHSAYAFILFTITRAATLPFLTPIFA